MEMETSVNGLCEDYYKGFCTRPDVPQSWCKYSGVKPEGKCVKENWAEHDAIVVQAREC